MPAVPTAARGAVITGWGTALPDKVVTNDDLQASGLDTNDEWIIERTGIRERRVGGTTASLSIEAGRQAIEQSGLDPEQIDALVLATTTPDRTVPATSATVQAELGLRCGAFDVNAACSGFTYALVVAHGLIAIGAEKILVIGTDTLSRIVDWDRPQHRRAVRRRLRRRRARGGRGPRPAARLGPRRRRDGRGRCLYAEVGGLIKMDGKEVFRRAVRIMVDSAEKSMKHAGVHGRRHRPRRAAPGEHPHHQGGLRPARHRRWTAPPWCSTAPATRRRRRSRSPWPTPSTTAASPTATWCCSSASAPG